MMRIDFQNGSATSEVHRQRNCELVSKTVQQHHIHLIVIYNMNCELVSKTVQQHPEYV